MSFSNVSITLDTDEIGNIQGIDNVNLKSITDSNNNIDYTNIEHLKKFRSYIEGDMPIREWIRPNNHSCYIE